MKRECPSLKENVSVMGHQAGNLYSSGSGKKKLSTLYLNFQDCFKILKAIKISGERLTVKPKKS